MNFVPILILAGYIQACQAAGGDVDIDSLATALQGFEANLSGLSGEISIFTSQPKVCSKANLGSAGKGLKVTCTKTETAGGGKPLKTDDSTASSDSCATALKSICPRSSWVTSQDCHTCVGRHQIALRKAQCTENQITDQCFVHSKWNQGSTFVISNWEAPQAAPGDGWAQRWDHAVQEMAAANFTVLMGGSGSGRLPTPGGLNKSAIQAEDFRVQLAVAKKYGMRLIGPTDPSYAALDMQTDVCMGSSAGPDCAEPGVPSFAGCANTTQKLRRERPGKLGFSFLLPSYACVPFKCQPTHSVKKGFEGADNYSDYVDIFMRTVQPDVLIADIYPFFEPEDDAGPASRAGYRANLAVLRNASQAAGVAFWTMFSVMPFAGHSDPTEQQLAWQMFTSMAYGSKGLFYFCYWSPEGQSPMFRHGGGVFTPQGTMHQAKGQSVMDALKPLYRKGPHYVHAKRLNSIVRTFGKYLVSATSQEVYRVTPAPLAPSMWMGQPWDWHGQQPKADLRGCVITNVTEVHVAKPNLGYSPGKLGEGLLIGQFKSAEKLLVMLHNQNPDFTLWPTIEFNASYNVSAILEVDPLTGDEVPLLDDSPAMPGLQLNFQAAMARLLIMPDV